MLTRTSYFKLDFIIFLLTGSKYVCTKLWESVSSLRQTSPAFLCFSIMSFLDFELSTKSVLNCGNVLVAQKKTVWQESYGNLFFPTFSKILRY